MSQDKFLEIHWLKNMVLSFQGPRNLYSSPSLHVSLIICSDLDRCFLQFFFFFPNQNAPTLEIEKIALNTKFNSYFIKGGINFVFHSQYSCYCYALPTIALGVYLSQSKLLQHPEPLATTTHSLQTDRQPNLKINLMQPLYCTAKMRPKRNLVNI